MFAKKAQAPVEDFSWSAGEGQLAVDVIEMPERVIIRSAIAGVQEQDLTITVNEDMVTIRGERHIDRLPLDATVHYEECFWGTFSRSIILPCRVKTDEADASLKNGVLVITLAKARGDVTLPVRKDVSL